jgi:predicted Zn-dependent protease
MEADHIGIMLMSQACYDPTTAPKFWNAFAEVLKSDEDGLDLDFFSTHPSHKKRERKLETLVPAALALQQQASWCFQVKERVHQLVEGTPEENGFLQRIRSFTKAQQQQQEGLHQPEPRRRYTMGTMHELENQEIYKGLRTERERKRAESS